MKYTPSVLHKHPRWHEPSWLKASRRTSNKACASAPSNDYRYHTHRLATTTTTKIDNDHEDKGDNKDDVDKTTTSPSEDLRTQNPELPPNFDSFRGVRNWMAGVRNRFEFHSKPFKIGSNFGRGHHMGFLDGRGLREQSLTSEQLQICGGEKNPRALPAEKQVLPGMPRSTDTAFQLPRYCVLGVGRREICDPSHEVSGVRKTGWFPKGWFWADVSRTPKNRNEGTKNGTTVPRFGTRAQKQKNRTTSTKTGTRAHPPKPPFEKNTLNCFPSYEVSKFFWLPPPPPPLTWKHVSL